MPILNTIARRYSALLGDRPADVLYRALCSLYFYRTHGYWPDLRRPRSYTEAIWNKQLFQRDPVLKTIADKFTMRDYVKERVGAEHLVPLLWHGTDPSRIPFHSLPERYVVKASHGSGYNLFVTPAKPLQPEDIRTAVRSWLKADYCLSNCVGSEWAYLRLRPTIMVEPFLDDGSGQPPADYKFHCFNGRVSLVQVDFSRLSHHTQAFFDREFNPLSVSLTYPLAKSRTARPAAFDQMVRLSEALSQGLDFVRVDLYATADQVYVGELTNYPGGGRSPFKPREFDRQLYVQALGGS